MNSELYKSGRGLETGDSRSEGLPEGYKRTELGVIPNDWSVFSLGELFDFHGTASNSRADLGDSGKTAYVHYGDIHTQFDHFIDFSRDNVPFLLPGKSVTTTRLRDGDLVVADASEDEDGVGKSVEIRNLGATEAISGLHTFLLRPKDNRVQDGYRAYLLECGPAKEQMRRLATGLKVFGISKQSIGDVHVLLPPVNEQRAIAEALSDVDGLLAELEALIAKKRAIKQAAVQQLLTGRSRLVGFSGEWETKRLGDTGGCLRGVSYDPTTDLSSNEKDSTVRLLRSNNIQDAVVTPIDVHYVEARMVSECQVMQLNDILVCMANGSKELIGKAGLFRIQDGYTYTFGAFMGCFRIEPTIADPRFVFYLFQTCEFRDLIGLILAGSSINNLKPSDIESAEFQFPDRNEQHAIAGVLSDIDTEIAGLERRRDKTFLVKRGMMQRLLTGRVRMVDQERTEDG